MSLKTEKLSLEGQKNFEGSIDPIGIDKKVVGVYKVVLKFVKKLFVKKLLELVKRY